MYIIDLHCECRFSDGYLNWQNIKCKTKCCNFIARKYATSLSDYYLLFNGNIYWIDNSSLAAYYYCGNFLFTIQRIDESLSLDEIEKICIKYIENICFV